MTKKSIKPSRDLYRAIYSLGRLDKGKSVATGTYIDTFDEWYKNNIEPIEKDDSGGTEK